jgi:DNA-binding NtrC family response regulator
MDNREFETTAEQKIRNEPTAPSIRLPTEEPIAPLSAWRHARANEREAIIDALSQCGGNQTQAAKLLGISRRTLCSRLDRYGIVRPRKSKAQADQTEE